MIAFDSDRGGNWNIFVMNADGSNVQQVTASPFRDRGPSWSPDGTNLVFQSNRKGSLDLYSIDVETSFVTQLTELHGDVTDPDWSRDGSLIAFIAHDRLYMLDLSRSPRKGTPADAFSASANVGQQVTISGAGFVDGVTIVTLEAMSQFGNPFVTTVVTDSVAADGTSLVFTVHVRGDSDNSFV